jgi:hypothetical protein
MGSEGPNSIVAVVGEDDAAVDAAALAGMEADADADGGDDGDDVGSMVVPNVHMQGIAVSDSRWRVT